MEAYHSEASIKMYVIEKFSFFFKYIFPLHAATTSTKKLVAVTIRVSLRKAPNLNVVMHSSSLTTIQFCMMAEFTGFHLFVWQSVTLMNCFRVTAASTS